MSIVKMDRLSVFGMESDKEAILERLQGLGIVQINNPAEKLEDDEWTGLVQRDGDPQMVSDLERRLTRVEQALSFLARFDEEKGGLFSTKKEVTAQKFRGLMSDEASLDLETDSVLETEAAYLASIEEENSLNQSLLSLRPWESYDGSLSRDRTALVRVLLGTLPANVKPQTLSDSLEAISPASSLEKISEDQDQSYISVMYMMADDQEMKEALRASGFSRVSFADADTPAATKARMEKRLEDIRSGRVAITDKAKSLLPYRDDLKCYADELAARVDRARTQDSLLRTEKAFTFDGWVPHEAGDMVKNLISEYDAFCEITPPKEGEETPVLLKNNAWAAPFESITQMYSLPSSNEVDPTALFSVFYFVFFGMMFADMGYGAILTIACVVLLKKLKPEGMFKKLLKLMVYCGISTFIWGLLFGGFFGNIIPVITRRFFGNEVTLTPLWFDPLSNPMLLLAFSCIIGVVHMFIGMGINAYRLIREKHVIEAVQKVFAWYLFIIGAALWLFGDSMFGGGSKAGLYMLAAGAILIVGLQAIRGKGIGRATGLYDLYGFTSYLSDILSYSRLLALGLASSVIAQVFNELGAMFGSGIVAVVLFIAIALVGHLLNFGINALGSFVHASRLQYVEFFGKFYDGGGEAFEPFTRKAKYVNVVQEVK